MNEPKKRPTVGGMIFGIVMFSAATLALVWIALDNEKGLRLLGITLSPPVATFFYWLCAAWTAGLVGLTTYRLCNMR